MSLKGLYGENAVFCSFKRLNLNKNIFFQDKAKQQLQQQQQQQQQKHSFNVSHVRL